MNTNLDFEKIYEVAKTLYKNVHVKKTGDGISIEQMVKDCCRDSFFIRIDLIGRVVTYDRKANKSDLEKLNKIFSGYDGLLTIINN